MLIDDVEGQIRPGDMLLCRGRALHSRIIQQWTRSVYSHVGVAHRVASCGESCLDILEAKEGSGIQTFPLRKLLAQGVAVDWFALVDPRINREEVVRWFWQRRGNLYSSPRQLIRSFVTVPLFDFLGLPTKIDGTQRFCSWIATEALLAGGWIPPQGDTVVPELTSPGAIALFDCLQRKGPLTLH